MTKLLEPGDLVYNLQGRRFTVRTSPVHGLVEVLDPTGNQTYLRLEECREGPETPELDRLRDIEEGMQTVRSFLHWLQVHEEYRHTTIQETLYRFFDIDSAKVAAERREVENFQKSMKSV